jgi:hypothetical protein
MDQQMSNTTRHSGDVWARTTPQPHYLTKCVPQSVSCHCIRTGSAFMLQRNWRANTNQFNNTAFRFVHTLSVSFSYHFFFFTSSLNSYDFIFFTSLLFFISPFSVIFRPYFILLLLHSPDLLSLISFLAFILYFPLPPYFPQHFLPHLKNIPLIRGHFSISRW